MKPTRRERLSADEHEGIVRLAALLRQAHKTGLGVAGRIRPARVASPRGRARSRLECVLHDFLAPAVRDVDSIAESAARSLEAEEELA